MINLYIGKENLPKDKHFIFDVEPYFCNVVLTGTFVQREAIRLLDKGGYLDPQYFMDRFYDKTSVNALSTSAKAIIELEGLPNCIVNCSECGDSALELISIIPNCNAFLEEWTVGLPWLQDSPITCNGHYWERISLLNDWLG